MSDRQRTLHEQPTSPGAQAPGEAAPLSNEPATDERATDERATAGGAGAADEARGHAAGGEPRGGSREGAAATTGSDEGAAEVQGDLDELVKTAAERDEYLALAQRTQADFENYRKRVARESTAAQERGMAALARELLPALDNLDRALADAGKAAGEDDPLVSGVRLVRSELSAALARSGIESFSPVGEPFDPSVHEAVATAPCSSDGAKSGTVLEVYQPGYRLGASVIRPARVVVAA
jgi:molecular chaperone GrpE